MSHLLPKYCKIFLFSIQAAQSVMPVPHYRPHFNWSSKDRPLDVLALNLTFLPWFIFWGLKVMFWIRQKGRLNLGLLAIQIHYPHKTLFHKTASCLRPHREKHIFSFFLFHYEAQVSIRKEAEDSFAKNA